MTNPLHVTGNIDTTGIAPGNQGTLSGISSLFDDLEQKRPAPKKASTDPLFAAAPDVVETFDTSGTDQPVAGYSNTMPGTESSPADAMPGHLDTSGTSDPSPLVDLGASINPDGEPTSDETEADETDDGDPAKVYDSMTVPQILSHAEANDHTFDDGVSRKADYIDSLMKAGIAPPA